MGGTKKGSKRTVSEPTYGAWQCLRDISNGIFGLLNTGRIFPAFGVLILMLMGVVIWRVPDTALAGLVKDFFSVLRSSFGFMAALFIASNYAWYRMFRKQKQLYEDEVKRIAEVRSELLHAGSNLVPIKTHRSSSEKIDEQYIFPETAKKEGKAQ